MAVALQIFDSLLIWLKDLSQKIQAQNKLEYQQDGICTC